MKTKAAKAMKRGIFPLYMGLFFLFLSSCNFPVRKPGMEMQPSIPLSTRSNGTPNGEYSETDIPAIQKPLSTMAPEDSPTATIAHLVTPGDPGAVEWYVTDYSSKSTAAEKRAPGGESYQYNLYERPFLAEDMKYLPGVDILRADMVKSGGWFYVTIRLQEAPTAEEKASARYGVEVDADIDGRGDYLIWTAGPGGTKWMTVGVQVWEDPNGDVGGPVAVRSDAPGTRDGYEKLAFDEGRGPDPDAAWSRFSPTDARQVQIAFKQTAIGNDLDFLWGAWADAGIKQPGWFDYDDHFTFSEAGSPLKGKAEYPLKALAAVDNTCRMSYGFTLLGTEPGACYIPAPTATPTKTATPTLSMRVTQIGLIQSVIIMQNKDSYTGACVSLHYEFWGQIAVNRAGEVKYVFERSTNGSLFESITGIQTMTFAVAGMKTTAMHSSGTSVSGVLTTRIHIVEPVDRYSNEVSVSITCT